MAGTTFQTNPIDLSKLLEDCDRGIIQLPDFQRSWVWDEDRIKSLIASISRAFPVGALMSLDTGGPVNFKPRPIEGAPPEAKQALPQSLLLDGQQRMTSLYQVTLRNKVVETVTPKRKKVKRWFYIDIRKAMDPSVDREEAIVGVPEDRIERADFGRTVRLDLSTPKQEYAELMYPVSQAFDWDRWQDGFDNHWKGDDNADTRELFRAFIHHIFPQDWCKLNGFKSDVYDSIINKTPLSFRTNRIIGGAAPSAYLAKLERGDSNNPGISRERLDSFLASHLIEPALLQADNFDAFMEDRQKKLLTLIEHAMGKSAYVGDSPEEGADVGGDETDTESELTISS